MRRIKVLSIISGLAPEAGGTSEAAANISVASQRAGSQNTLVFPTDTGAAIGPALKRLINEGVRVDTFALTPSSGSRARRWGISARLGTWILRHARSFDIIHVHGAWSFSSLCGLLAGACLDRPVVMTPHESLTSFDVNKPGNPIRPHAKRALKAIYLRQLALVVFSSHLEEKDTLRNGHYTLRSSVIPHPLGSALDFPRAPAHSNDGTFTVGFLGRLHPKKNLEVLIEAVGHSPEEIRLRIAGDGMLCYRRYIEALIDTLDVAHRVEWLGFVTGAARWRFIDSLDVLAMPSHYECFGMVAAEAMARETAVIVTENSGVAELIASERDGLVIAPTVTATAEALRRLRDDRSFARTLAVRGRATVQRLLSLEAYGQRLNHEYTRLVSG